MKDEKTELSISKATFAYLAKLLKDREVITFLDKNYIEQESKLTISQQAQVKATIRKFLREKSIPEHFTELFFSLICNKKPEHPLSPTLSIEVAGQPLNEEGSVLLISDANGLLADRAEIAIKIHATTSIDEIIKFISNNKNTIESAMDALHLPQIPSVSKWKQVVLALEIIEMKDKERMSFSEISNVLSSKDELSPSDIDYLSNESNVKNLYYRYRSHFSQP